MLFGYENPDFYKECSVDTSLFVATRKTILQLAILLFL